MHGVAYRQEALAKHCLIELCCLFKFSREAEKGSNSNPVAVCGKLTDDELTLISEEEEVLVAVESVG